MRPLNISNTAIKNNHKYNALHIVYTSAKAKDLDLYQPKNKTKTNADHGNNKEKKSIQNILCKSPFRLKILYGCSGLLRAT